MDAIQVFLEKIKGTKFEKDMDTAISLNGCEVSLGYYNLALSIRDMKMYVKFSIKPHRGWKISDVKKYYGLKGDKVNILEGLLIYQDCIQFCEENLNSIKKEVK
jgi:hypothetical protein